MRLFRFTITLIVAAFLFFIPFLILRFYIDPAYAYIIAGSLSVLALLIGMIKSFKVHETKETKNVHTMEDRKMKCPNCGSILEAAFMGNQLAMDYKCEHCGFVIKKGEAPPID